MAAPFTDTEVETAVAKIVRSAIRRQYGGLGQRDVGTMFNDFQEQTIAVLTLTPNAPFYVVKLGVERLGVKIGDLSTAIENLDEVVQAMARTTTSVDSLSSLSNAKVAADALATAASSRGRAYTSITEAPAFQNLDRNIQQFLTDYSKPNIQRNSQVVRTAQEARGLLAGYVQDLETARSGLIEQVGNLSGSIADYEAMNLPALLSSGVVTRASQVIADRTQQLEQLTPETRVQYIRDVTLDLLAARTVIRNFGSLATPTTFVVLEGSGAPYADALHPAVPARLVSAYPGPYPLRSDTAAIVNQLDLLIDGTFRTIAATGSGFLAQLTGTSPGPFDIVASPSTEQNDTLVLVATEGSTTIATLTVTLTAGVGRTLDQVVADINAAVTTQPIEAQAVIAPLKFQGKVTIGGTDPGAVTFTLTNPLSSWTAIGINEGDLVRVLEGSNVSIKYQVNVGGITGTTLTCTRLTGAGTVGEANRLVEAGGPNQVLRLKLTDTSASAALPNFRALKIDDSTDIRKRTAGNLGFSPGAKATSRPLTTSLVAQAINSASTLAAADTARLKASVTRVPVQIAGITQTARTARSEPSAPQELVVYRFRGRGDCTVGGLAPQFTATGLSATNPLIGDNLVVRASTVSTNIGVVLTVTGVAGDTLICSSPSVINLDTNVLFEVLPNLAPLPIGSVVVVGQGIDAGAYTVTAKGTVSAELTLDRPLGSSQDFGGQPVFLSVDLTQEYLVLDSTVTNLTSAVQVDNGSPGDPYSAAGLFFGTIPAISTATTPYFLLPQRPSQAIEAGDLLELYTVDYANPTYTFVVVSFDSTNLVLELDKPMGGLLGSFSFTIGAALPYARIRKIRKDTFDTFAANANGWLAQPALQDLWLSDLDRLVTMLLAEASVANVQTLRAHLVKLYGLLTVAGATVNAMVVANTIEAIAEAYDAPNISEIDTLVESLHAQGGDRAVDILLSGRFRDYFGLSQDQMSYAGTVLSTTQQIMQSDLQVRSVRRKEAAQRQVSIGEYEDTDYEYNQSDIDNSLVPDSPGTNPMPTDGDAY